MKSKTEELKEKVLEIVSNFFNVKGVEVSEETDLANDLGADSLDGVELIMIIEEEFDIEIPDDDAKEIRKVRDIIKYLQTQTA